MRKIFYLLVIMMGISFAVGGRSLAQVEEEKQARVAEMQMLRAPAPSYYMSSQAALFAGYDSNVTLSPEGKGSVFQEFLYSLNFDKPLADGYRFSFDYDLDYLNYSEAASSSNLLNHLRFGLHKKLNRSFGTGLGYDFSDFYYPSNADGDYMFHKGFVYLRNTISRETYQQLTLEYGYKRHISRKALSDTLTSLQAKELVDYRQSVAYTIGSTVFPRLSLRFMARFSKNESNARYLDFYDYKSYEASPSLVYKLSEAINLVVGFTYLRKNYTERTLSVDASKKENDNVYYVNAGARFKVDKDNSATLFYTYRDNHTNEPLEKYNENVITVGWEHKF